jgi:hypothetical protein
MCLIFHTTRDRRAWEYLHCEAGIPAALVATTTLQGVLQGGDTADGDGAGGAGAGAPAAKHHWNRSDKRAKEDVIQVGG